MSATCGKNRSKLYKTDLGNFKYNDILLKAFSYGIIKLNNGVQIASKEKALCDTLYLEKPIRSVYRMKEFLFDDLRIDKDKFMNLNFKDLKNNWFYINV
ncbi:MAG: hypothetical protein WCR97_02370 [Bacilli bacterium]